MLVGERIMNIVKCPVCNRDIDPPNEEGEMCWQCRDLLYNDRDYEEVNDNYE